MPSTHNKGDKPWDTPDIDKWQVEPFKPEDNAGGTFAEESSFMVLFPKYREQYLKEAWPGVTKALQQHGIACTLDLVDGKMEVKTTRKSYDPAAILKARDLIKLLARSVPAPQALRILGDDVACDIIKIRNLVNNKEKFIKRRQRILGSGGQTLKAIEILTSTYILIQGNTVSAIGPYKGLKEVRRLVEDCMANVHPIYRVKELMIKRELAKDPELAKEDWSRFLPNYKKSSLSRRRTPFRVTDKSKKVYTPFPPAPEPSKLDLQLAAGELHVGREARKRAADEDRAERQRARKEDRKRERELDFVAPDEPSASAAAEGERRKKKRRTKSGGGDADGEE